MRREWGLQVFGGRGGEAQGEKELFSGLLIELIDVILIRCHWLLNSREGTQAKQVATLEEM